MRWRPCGPSWRRCAPTWRFCSTRSSASDRRCRPNARRFVATASGIAKARAPMNESTGSPRCGPRSHLDVPTTGRSLTSMRSPWSLPRRGSAPGTATSRRTATSPLKRMRPRGRPGPPRSLIKYRNKSSVPSGVKARKPEPRVTRWRHQQVGRPRRLHLRQGHQQRTPQIANQTAGAGLRKIDRRKPRVEPRLGHGWLSRPASRSDSSPHHRGVHIGGLNRPRRPSPSSRRRPYRHPSRSSCRRPYRHRSSRGPGGRRHRKSRGAKSSRPGSRSVQRGNGCPPEHPAAIGIPVWATAPARRRTASRHNAPRAPVTRFRRPRLRSSDADGIPALWPSRRQTRSANPHPNGVSRAVVLEPGTPRNTPTSASPAPKRRRRRCRHLRPHRHRHHRHRLTEGRR